MGWKASFVIIKNPSRRADQQLLDELGFNHLHKIDDKRFGDVIDPNSHSVFLGSYQDNIIVCNAEIPSQLIQHNQTNLEQRLIQLFPKSEICAIVLHSVVNLWGYSIIVNGQKVRARAGCSDDGTYIEFGAPLDEEMELLSKSTLDDQGNRVYTLDDFPDEILEEDVVGENFVFSICERYFGASLDDDDGSLFNTIFMGYSYRNIVDKQYGTSIQNQSKQDAKKPWWKFGR